MHARLAELLAANKKTQADLDTILQAYAVDPQQFEGYLAELFGPFMIGQGFIAPTLMAYATDQQKLELFRNSPVASRSGASFSVNLGRGPTSPVCALARNARNRATGSSEARTADTCAARPASPGSPAICGTSPPAAR